jgi:mevalonate kinase
MSLFGVGRAPGKVILAGEHAVVYGYPAIVLAIDRFVEVLARPGGTLEPPRLFSFAEPDPACAAETSLQAVLERARECLGFAEQSVHLEVRSNLPPSVGLGSSAALSVATLRALADLYARPLSPQSLCKAAFALEQLFHGQPSGIDHTAAVLGGALRFTKGEEPTFLELLAPPPLVVIIGRSRRRTRTVVERLAQLRERAPEFVHVRLEAIAALVRAAERALVTAQWPLLGSVFVENHALLRELGISTEELDELVRLAQQRGAYGAKLTGGGGGGAVVCLVPEPREEFAAWFRQQGWDAFPVEPFVFARASAPVQALSAERGDA